MSTVAGFLPSTGGFRFPNAWPKVPVTTLDPLPGVHIPVGDASNGLCGGMVFAARDFFEAGLALPGDTTAPGSGPLYEYIGDRLIESFDLPNGPLKYYAWMAMPDEDVTVPWIATLTRGVGYRTVHDELAKITADLDGGRLCCLGLVCAHSVDPMQLGENHQVLAWRHERSGTTVTLWIYDPNQPGDDDARLTFDTAHPSQRLKVELFGSSKRVRGIFPRPVLALDRAGVAAVTAVEHQ